MGTQEILELVKIIESHDIEEIEIKKWFGTTIRITKRRNGSITTAVSRGGNVKTQPELVKTIEEGKDKELPKEEVAEEVKSDKLYEVKTPIVGTFYRAPSPDADPYVKVGDHVTQGKPLCIIEAMKIMNVIESEVSGTIKKILVENGQPVEYNQTLFIIEKD
ncbi:MAG: acetyl-CoA carboxylase biotin carboxyl carrier protein [Candidatus Marinimicrobia bacterium]|nr:acetyl-CoA carboxylase biotin carboxyl carrier protein [Candidatus Neomarinimicrobiota bacterium]